MNLPYSALDISARIKRNEITVREVLDECFDRIDRLDCCEGGVNSFITVCREEAYRQADEVQKRLSDGDDISPLAGVPIAVKDNICTKGIRTTCASKILENFVPTYNAEVINRLYGAGLILIGKLNMDEFAMGSTTETSAFGATLNPADKTRVPGGSSGGAAAAVAAGLVPLSLGSDTGGSIRQPCSFCGAVGLKPTYGAVSRYGLVAYASSLDQIGPIGNSAADCEALFEIISGKDEKDGTSVDYEFSGKVSRFDGVKGMKIGIVPEFFGDGLNGEVGAAVKKAAEQFEKMGAETVTVPMEIARFAIPTYYIIACAEACSNLARYDGIKYGYSSPEADDLISTYVKSRSEGFGLEVKSRIMLGNFVLSSGYYDAYYNKALKAKQLIGKAFREAFEKCDMIISPVYPTTAMKLSESLSDPLKLYLGDIYTVMVNLAGLPSLALPCGKDSENLPIGFQLIGKAFGEPELFAAGKAYREETK